MPASASGRWAVGLALALLALARLLDPGAGGWSGWAAAAAVLALTAGAAAAGLHALLRARDRSAAVIAATALALCAIAFAILVAASGGV